jgi:3-oxoadipate enol-lactonase
MTAQHPGTSAIDFDFDHSSGLGYLRSGSRGRSILWLHGWGGFKELWWQTLRDLGRDHRNLAPDLPGHGASPLRSSTELAAIASRVKAFAEQHLHGPFVLVGHSMGGGIAAELALQAPQLIERLILVDPAIDAHRMPSYTRTYLQPVIGWPMFRFANLIGKAVRPLADAIPHEHGGGNLRPWLRRAAVQSQFEPAEYHALLPSLFATRAGERLQQLQMPTLLVSGRFDTLVPPQLTRDLQQHLPHAEYVEIAASGHNPMDEQPAEFTRVVRNFLQGPVSAA